MSYVDLRDLQKQRCNSCGRTCGCHTLAKDYRSDYRQHYVSRPAHSAPSSAPIEPPRPREPLAPVVIALADPDPAIVEGSGAHPYRGGSSIVTTSQPPTLWARARRRWAAFWRRDT